MQDSVAEKFKDPPPVDQSVESGQSHLFSRSNAGKMRRLVKALCTMGLVGCCLCVFVSLRLGYETGQASAAPAYRIDINTACAHEIAQLPGWGLSLGRAVVKSRQERGRFESLDRLLRVPGVSVRLINRARPYIHVGDDPARDQPDIAVLSDTGP